MDDQVVKILIFVGAFLLALMVFRKMLRIVFLIAIGLVLYNLLT